MQFVNVSKRLIKGKQYIFTACGNRKTKPYKSFGKTSLLDWVLWIMQGVVIVLYGTGI